MAETAPHTRLERPQVIPRDAHSISRAQISESALKVLRRLQGAGFEAYLVGGGVRDLLLGMTPKDFDVATDARPEQVRELFRNSRIIGRRFKIVHVRFGREIIEVSTFRAAHDADTERGEGGRVLRDNTYGSIDSDARRRDFTVNALYYTPEDFSIVDFVGGMADLAARRLRIIGDPEQRYREDPVRMLRALRLAAKLDFEIDPDTEEPIRRLAELLHDIPAARLFDELVKLFLTGHAEKSWHALLDSPLLVPLLPVVAESLDTQAQQLIEAAMRNTDRRIAEDRPVTAGFLVAALLWPAVRQGSETLCDAGLTRGEAIFDAGGDVLAAQHARTTIPRRHSQFARETWSLQPRLERRRVPHRTLEQGRFRAAYDLLELRAAAGEVEQGLVAWWDEYQHADPEQREAMAGKLPRRRRTRRRAARE